MSVQIIDRRAVLKGAFAASFGLAFSPRGWAQGIERDRTEWYRHAKFGMFIHWGPYSQASVEASWSGRAAMELVSFDQYRLFFLAASCVCLEKTPQNNSVIDVCSGFQCAG